MVDASGRRATVIDDGPLPRDAQPARSVATLDIPQCTASEVWSHIESLGCRLDLAKDRESLRTSRTLQPEMVEVVRRHKAAIVAMLRYGYAEVEAACVHIVRCDGMRRAAPDEERFVEELCRSMFRPRTDRYGYPAEWLGVAVQLLIDAWESVDPVPF